MMKFNFVAVKDNERITESREAVDRFVLARDLKSEGFMVISVEEEAESGASLWKKINARFSTVNIKEKIFFVSNLGEMLKAGLTLTRALKVAAKQTKNPKLKKIIDDLMSTIDRGGNFADALRKFPKVFSPTTVAMVEAGEASGRIPESLEIVGRQMMKTYTLKKRIRGALIYPGIIITAMVLIGIMMLVYVVPTLKSTFEELGAELPFSTQLIIGFSDFVTNHYLLMLLAVVGTILGAYQLFKIPSTKRIWAAFLVHMPIIGPIVKKANSALTARTLSSLLISGVDIVAALTITRKVVQNPYYRDIIRQAEIELPKGTSLTKIFGGPESEKYYPPFVGEMMSVGEETGKLPDMLLKLANFYEGEVDAVVKDLSTVIEPIIMLLVGLGVGFFALSMIQPIYEVGNNI